MTKLRILADDAILSIGVIGYDFFANFTIAADRVGGKMSVVKS